LIHFYKRIDAMALALRLVSRNLVVPNCGCFSPLTYRAMATMKPMSAEEHTISRTGFWAKNKALGRPMSPHLTIYKFQITSVMSVTHRATGIIQSGLLSLFAIGVMVLPGSFPTMLAQVQDFHFAAPLIFLAKFGLAWPFTYHLLNGVRHLAWDLGKGFKLPELYKTGYVVLGLSVFSALVLALI